MKEMILAEGFKFQIIK